METRKLILVVDVPANATAEEVEQKLAAPLESEYYLVGNLHTEGNIRAIYKLRTHRQNRAMPVEKIRLALAAKGIRRSKDWIAAVKKDA